MTANAPGAEIEDGHELVAAIDASHEEVFGAAPERDVTRWFSDASALTLALGSPPTAIMGPGEMAIAHQTDEYCFVSRIEQATELYAELVRNWCDI